MKAKLFVFMTLILFAFTLNINAQTTIPGGHISGVWNLAGSPYRIIGEITVLNHDTLSIEPGVEVIFQGYFQFIINGMLEAEGTESDSILFTAANTFEGWGGIRFYNAPDTSRLSFCIIEYGHAEGSTPDDYGGGIYSFDSTPFINSCTFRYNYGGDHGGGIYCDNSNPSIINCNFFQNEAQIRGAGIYCYYSTPVIDGCTFIENDATGDDGGGIYLDYSDPTIQNCDFYDNRADDDGGAIQIYHSHPIFNNCAFGRNYAEDLGGAISAVLSTFTIDKCTLTENRSDYWGDSIYSWFADGITIINCIIWDNQGEAGFHFRGDPIITYSNIQGGWSGEGNIDIDPRFVDPAGGNIHLQVGSPCIDSGNPDPLYTDPDNTRSDMGAYYYYHDFQICPSLLDFGSVATGSSIDLPLTITNVSNNTIIMRDFLTSGSCFVTNFDPVDSLLLPADSLVVTVTFTPSTIAVYDDTLTIANSSEDWTVSLLGEAMEGGTSIPGGNISGIWDISGSPYWIDGEITIPAGETLNIDPGVEVFFQGHYKLIVNGMLEAVGTETDSILFTAVDTAMGWQGIRFIDAPDSSHLSYCNIRYGRLTGMGIEYSGGGIYCENSNPVISNSTIAYCSSVDNGGGIGCNLSSPTIAYNLITGCFAVARGGGIYCSSYSTPRIIENIIEFNQSDSSGGAISLCDSSAAYIGRNGIRNNIAYYAGGIDLWLSDANIDGNIIVGNIARGMGGINSYDSYSIIKNNVIMDHRSDSWGSGIFASFSIGGQSGTVIEGNYISRNHSYNKGGGIATYGTNASQIISKNIIIENSARIRGGGIYCHEGGATITDNFILNNMVPMTSTSGGGGIYADPFAFILAPVLTISRNTICGNRAPDGGGILMRPASPGYTATTLNFTENIISFNRANLGGGLYIHNYTDIYNNENIIKNVFSRNTAYSGGGIYMDNVDALIGRNTICSNHAQEGSGIYGCESNSSLVDHIFWGYTETPIELENCPGFSLIYSDIEGGWEGAGNIDADPQFIDMDHNDYRLQWGSPCIDSGNPWSLNDPDGTCADMGAFYYDQSIPFRVLVTPRDTPIAIPSAGEDFSYNLQITNNDSTAQQFDVRCIVKSIDNTMQVTTFGPVTVFLEGGETQSITRTQRVPAGAAWGIYTFIAYAATATDTSEDSFRFCKLYGEENGTDSEWSSQGDLFGTDAMDKSDIGLPEKFSLEPNYPNPFNQQTTISFDLPVAGDISLKVFDITGREVAALGIGHWALGRHSVVWDAEGVASGVYFVRLTVDGQKSMVRKVVLMK